MLERHYAKTRTAPIWKLVRTGDAVLVLHWGLPWREFPDETAAIKAVFRMTG